jgi:PGF-CTERM protein
VNVRRETPLAVGAALLLVTSVGAAVLAPGVLAESEGPVRAGHVDIREVTVRPQAVGGETVSMGVEARLRHGGGPVENVTVLVRATDLDTGFVAANRTIRVGRLTDEREVPVTGTLGLERAGGYRIETVVFRDGRRVAVGGKEIRGLDTLPPAYAESPVEFSRFAADLPTVAFSVAGVEANRTTLRVSTHLTNQGGTPASGYRLELLARQADSNIVADSTGVDVGAIPAGNTASPTTTLTVPDGYNYYLDAVLWKDGVVVGTARSAANLAPEETLSVDEQRRTIDIEVSDFTTAGPGAPDGRPTTTEAAGIDGGGVPGFTAGLTLVALAGAAVLLSRRAHE